MTMWAATFENVAVTALQDLFELNAPTNIPVCLHRVLITQHSDFGDAQAEILRVRFIRGFTTSGSGGTTPTATDLGTQGATYGGSVEANNTTPANTGTTNTPHVEAWNVATALDYMPPPEQRIWLKGGDRLVVNLPVAPNDSLSVDGTIVFETP